jgi:hypothetical protein
VVIGLNGYVERYATMCFVPFVIMVYFSLSSREFLIRETAPIGFHPQVGKRSPLAACPPWKTLGGAGWRPDLQRLTTSGTGPRAGRIALTTFLVISAYEY